MNWFNKTDYEIIQRLKNVLKTEEFQFIGKFEEVPNKDFGFFKEVRSLSGVKKFYPKDDGSTDDKKIRPLEIFTKAYDQLIPGKWYKFYAVPAANPLRKDKRNPFLLQTDWKRVKDIVLLKGNELIENIKNDALNTPEGIAGNLMRAIETISIDINTEPTTFIFELIQNADDYPNSENNVSIIFQITNSNLIIKHNGSKFEVNNTVALCGVNEGDKREDKTKIGFKGIGFKSIFKDSNYAYIKSGDFSFRFDEAFWKSQGIEIFWHITPINTPFNEFKSILVEESNVNIIIKPKEQEILQKYKNTFISHFNDERILLFLRNVKSLIFDSSEEKFEISNISSRWKIFIERDVSIPVEETNDLNRRINFPDKRIPVKFYDINSTEIGFAFKINDNIVESINDGCIYAYLPTKINLGFSFIINGNFIPDASRTKIYADLTWNCFLFEKAGELFLKQIILLISENFDNESIFEQIPIFSFITTNTLDEDKKTFLDNFKTGFDKEILNQPFIPNKYNKLETLSNIIVDETGLSTLLNDDFFILTELNGNLINNQLGKGIEKVKALLKEYNLACNIYTINDLKSDLKKEVFQEWLKIPQNNFKIIQHFYINKNLNGLLETEKIILTANNELCIVSDVYNKVPDVVTFIAYEELNDELSNLLTINNITLELKVFNPVDFYNENIFSKQNSINEKLSNELELLNFWRFIYDFWHEFEKEDNIKASLKLFRVLCKSLNEESLYANIISTVYIAAGFNTENEIESVITEIGIQNAKFISEKYISGDRISSKWYRIFKQALAISDLQKVIEILLPSLSTIEHSKHFEIAKQIFKYWKENQNKETQLSEYQLNLIRKNLKIKGVDNNYYASNAVIISDHYNNNTTINSILSIIELPNQISSEYGPRTNQIADWKNFFSLLNCIELSEKQSVLDEKIDFFVDNQDSLVDKHFEFLISLSELFKAKSEKGFEFPDDLSKIKLLTDSEEWCLPSEIHFSSIYKPKLDLQKDDLVKENVKFLCTKYIPKEIDKSMMLEFGVQSDFIINKTGQELLSNVTEMDYCKFIINDNKYIQDRNQLLRNWTYSYTLESITYLSNHYKLNYSFLIENTLYYDKFIDFLVKRKNFEFIYSETILSIWNNRVFPQKTFIYFLLNKFPNLLTKANSREKPNNLFATKLSKYIMDESKIPAIDFSEIIINEDNLTLEEAIGINQFLSLEYCVNILARIENRISIEEVLELKIIDLLEDYIPSEKEIANIFLLNENLDWKPVNELFFSNEEKFVIESSQKLHEEFISIANNFGVKELSSENLILKTTPENTVSNNDIKAFFESKAKFIAFKIDHLNYKEIEEQIIDNIKVYNFIEVSSIVKVFPLENPIYTSNEYLLYNDGNSNNILYKNYWKSNNEMIDFLFTLLSNDRLDRKWFENLINRWDDNYIIEKLNEDIGITPQQWKTNQTDENDVTKSDFFTEVENFIESMKEVEDIYDADKIEDLKSILAEFKNHPKEKQMTFNLLAKLKLCKKLRLEYDKTWEYNSIVSGDKKYLIHSARGSFAYIHPNEILKMKDEGYKMAIDYGTEDIRIYNSHSEIISLYQNYLMLYQGNPSEEDILSICENSVSKEKFHFLIADREKQVGEGLAIFKFLNNDNYD